ncbi:N-glycosylase/DNA lyase [Natronincola peptidivorans]|uniref:DNA-(apurinic or apyrimidinic site) lyase n=2 Tax=Natronincola peptidivorans TaxID=426128 RepID=A0A1I0A0E8_9FIRM|nr:N-glycosylase/DNA lyase [Natronincola peptidivorans]
MQLDIQYKDNEVIIMKGKDFEPAHIFQCGQCFRWYKESDDSYTGIVQNKALNVGKIDGNIIFKNTNKEDFLDIWMDYFDLKTDYDEIKKKISRKDPIMQNAVSFGEGIRILKQEPWETLISFIISSNNNIPRIKASIEKLSEEYGEYLGVYCGKKRFGFPKPEVLAALSVEKIAACGTGYRASYIKSTAAAIAKAPTALETIKSLDIENCQRRLMEYQGVGPKVAQCILFFSMGKMEAFPVDVWVKRVMEHFYFHKETPASVIQQFAWEKYGGFAGYAQQYLFYYAREQGIGKK